MSRLCHKRQLMGEAAWAEHQKNRKNNKATKYRQTNKGKLNAFKVAECRRNNKLQLIEYKGGKCANCGYDKMIPGAYDFHHRNPETKEFGIACEGKTKSIKKLKEEADKCDLLCKLCHAEIHHYLELKNIDRLRSEIEFPVDE
jgi:hypothetical protein